MEACPPPGLSGRSSPAAPGRRPLCSKGAAAWRWGPRPARGGCLRCGAGAQRRRLGRSSALVVLCAARVAGLCSWPSWHAGQRAAGRARAAPFPCGYSSNAPPSSAAHGWSGSEGREPGEGERAALCQLAQPGPPCMRRTPRKTARHARPRKQWPQPSAAGTCCRAPPGCRSPHR